jgi:putative drug exporter of the RND superfamily
VVTSRRKVTIGWLLACFLSIAFAAVFGGSFTDGIRLAGTESAAAESFAAKRAYDQLAVTSRLIVATTSASALQQLEQRLILLDGVSDVRSGGDHQLSSGGTHRLVDVAYEFDYEPTRADVDALVKLLGETQGLTGEVGGLLPDLVTEPTTSQSEVIGLLVSLMVLRWAFRSLKTAFVHLGSAFAALGVSFPIIVMLARWAPVPSSSLQLAGLLGVAVGIDYAMFLASSESGEELARLKRRCKLCAALVACSMLALWVAGIPFLAWMGTAAAIAVVVATVSALTIVPAWVVRSENSNVPSARHSKSSRVAGFLERALVKLVAQPLLPTLLALAILCGFASQAANLTIGSVGASTQPASTTQRRAADLISTHFGAGANNPFMVTVDLLAGTSGDRQRNIETIRAQMDSVPGVRSIGAPNYGRSGEEAWFEVRPNEALESLATKQTLAQLRVVAPAWVLVGGPGATKMDVAERVSDRLPILIAIVLVISLFLLAIGLRSVAVAVKAVVLNLLTVTASFGLLSLVFPVVDPLVPIFLFAILFGVSMDYEVFMIGAIQDERSGSAAGRSDGAALSEIESIRRGLWRSARVVSGAALIMISIFSSFMTAADEVTRQFGVGLGAAVLLDVTLIRFVLLPGCLRLFGKWNWWFPFVNVTASVSCQKPSHLT